MLTRIVRIKPLRNRPEHISTCFPGSSKLRAEMLESWVQVLAGTLSMAAIRRAWARMRPTLEEPKRWLRVKGPVAAVIATLGDLRWKAISPDE